MNRVNFCQNVGNLMPLRVNLRKIREKDSFFLDLEKQQNIIFFSNQKSLQEVLYMA